MESELIIVVTVFVFAGIVYAVSKGRAKKSGPKPSTTVDRNEER